MDWGDASAWAAVAASVVAIGVSIRTHKVGKSAASASERSATAAEQSAADGRRSADAAADSAASAEAVAKIDHARWLAELTPQFELTLDETLGGRATLLIHLAGPDPLCGLDEVVVRVADDDMDHTVLNPGHEVTQAEADAHVWGPFRFAPRVNGADEHGRQIAPFPLAVGRGHPFAMERTMRGHWMTGLSQESWQARYVGLPIRLVLTCRRGSEEWVVARRIANPPVS